MDWNPVSATFALARSITELAAAIRWHATETSNENRFLRTIISHLEQIMARLDDFQNAVNAEFDKIEASHAALADDVTFLKEEVAKFAALATDLTVEEKAALDAIKSRAESISGKLSALDSETTRPTPPPE
jgi:chromosome segregation ATPase